MTELKIESVELKWEVDEYPDTSYLGEFKRNGSYESCNYDTDSDDPEIQKYIEQDKQRLLDYGNTWHCLGCTAKMVVSYKLNEQGDRRLETLKSGGLWGIESDSPDEYFEDIAIEALNDLALHVNKFGIEFEPSDYEGELKP